MSGDILGVILGAATGIEWVETKNIAKHPAVHKRALYKKELSCP